ncbi:MULTISPECIES: Zn-dependent hydrolase [Ramlibacter]|uniref:Hydantoinase/carbamoylase family amidase n=1 Tax=Ramlibacter pinisoli TaxID=2682844 RepID=A0A6N8IRE6_9BURK|nr:MULTISPECIES: Zn-dependent hydrolase [Ramlibacter]MBA2964451.1 hydantoinase/carbamoylase family amidase [Ramlibacter sp. CGMCC 1.13660]MVQ29417.1 hydantoinase/carbamoylase family amidase [Ramlibacter pinisoli]
MTSVPGPDLELAAQLFEQLRRDSFDGRGVTRDAYGPGEQRAHELMARTARGLDLEVSYDAARNLYLTLRGRDRGAPCAMTGSHLDSVPCGGNFDGAAGVVAGLAVLAGWRRAGFVPQADVVVMGVRAEESTWFPFSYLGSKAAFGKVPRDVLQLRRSDTQRSFADHLAECGGDPARLGEAALVPSRIARFVELHIEQGPVLVEAGLPVGVVTGIRGSLRYRDARVLGEYAHSGAVPRGSRRDAVRAAALLVAAVDADWERMEGEGDDLVVTFGKFFTDPAQHAFSKVAGEAGLCVDVRSLDLPTLEKFDGLLQRRAAELAEAAHVRFELGPRTGSDPAAMDARIQDELTHCAAGRGIAAMSLASGAGHDAAVFAQMGIPTGMVFVRNDCGSHNPMEKMDLADFALGATLLGDVLALPAT